MKKVFYRYNGVVYSNLERVENMILDQHPELFDDTFSDYVDSHVEEVSYADENECSHDDVNMYAELYACQTLYDPAEYIYTAHCNICGLEMDGEEVPEDAHITDK